jgi:hypothetical protein
MNPPTETSGDPDYLGRTVVVVPKGQSIPTGLTVEPDDAITSARDSMTAPTPRVDRRPEPDIGGQQRVSTRVARMIHLATRPGP